MHPPDALHICTDCSIEHYDNCTQCFGFGVQRLDGRLYPVSAGRALDGVPVVNPEPCPVCRSTLLGLPDGA